MENKLDHAVVLERRQGDDLRRSSHDDPESWMAEDFLDVHGLR